MQFNDSTQLNIIAICMTIGVTIDKITDIFKGED